MSDNQPAPTDESAGIVERLLKVESSGTDYTGITTCWYRNPDGPEAATLITKLTAERDEARGLLKDARAVVVQHNSSNWTAQLRERIDAALASISTGER